MDPVPIQFDQQRFSELFPFHIRMDKKLRIIAAGRSMKKLVPEVENSAFDLCFTIYRPSIISDHSWANDLLRQMIMFKTKGNKTLLFKGQLEPDPATGGYLLLANPWFTRMEDTEAAGLNMEDFPLYDNTIDLLHVVKTGEIATTDLRELVSTIRKQKEELRKYSTNLEQLTKQASVNEKKYRSIIENMNLGLLEVDLEERMTFANQRFCKMSGYSLESLIGHNPRELFVKGNDAQLIREKNDLRRNGVSDAYEVLVNVNNGESRWWLISGAPRYDEKGELVGTIGIHLDITEQKKLELELIEAREKASSMARSRELFLANMSHEMRTPMNAIIGISNQLSKSQLTNQQHFYLDVIQRSSENLLMIMNDILDISKIEAGKLSIESIGFDPLALVTDALTVLRYKAEEKGIRLNYSLKGGLLSSVLIGDPFRVNQVLMNLLGNAIKFTKQGYVQLKTEIVEDQPTHQDIIFSIIDTGIGMDEKFMHRVFDPFRQEHVSTSRKFGGSGLGMSISKQLVELMGGSIQISSQKGKGTTVSFRIKFNKGEAKDLPRQEVIQLRPDALRKKKILVVDDNEVNRMIAAKILQDQGCVILEAADGQEALDQAFSKKPDIILMDLQMPILNGLEAARLLRKNQFKKPIIALTANALKGEDLKCLEAGMNDYIVKPFVETDLLKKIEKWIYSGKSQQFRPALSESDLDLPEGYYSLEQINRIGNGDKAFVSKMLRLFCRQTPELLREMRSAWERSDKPAIAALAHKMKPSIDNLFIQSLREEVRILEMSVINEVSNERIAGLIEKINMVMDEIIPLLLAEADQLGSAPSLA